MLGGVEAERNDERIRREGFDRRERDIKVCEEDIIFRSSRERQVQIVPESVAFAASHFGIAAPVPSILVLKGEGGDDRERRLAELVREAREAGYAGIELGNKFPRQADVLRPLLERHDLAHRVLEKEIGPLTAHPTVAPMREGIVEDAIAGTVVDPEATLEEVADREVLGQRFAHVTAA